MKSCNANFIISAEKLSQCPDFTMPEFPLLGRSNVGKSSFINALANNKKLAKTSNTPGKTFRDTGMQKFLKKLRPDGRNI